MMMGGIPYLSARHGAVNKKRYYCQWKKSREGKLDPRSLVPIMLRSEDVWKQVSPFVCTMMRRKMETEWTKQKMQRATP